MCIITHHSFDEINQIRSYWVEHQNHPNSDLEHFTYVCENRKPVINPFVISIWDDNTPVCLLVGRLELQRSRPRIGYLKIGAFTTRTITFITGGIIGNVPKGSIKDLQTKLKDLLRSESIDRITFTNLRESNPLWNLSPGYTHKDGIWSTHRLLALNTNPDQILLSMKKKHRYNIRRSERALAENYSNNIEWIWHTSFSSLKIFLSEIEDVAKETYQRGLGSGFIYNEENKERYRIFAERGILRGLVLKVNGSPQAFWIGQVYNKTFHSDATGYKAQVQQYGVGTSLLMRLTDNLIEEGVQYIDYGLGDGDYKQRFSTESFTESNLELFAPTIKGQTARLLIKGADYIHRKLTTIIHENGATNKIRTYWRRQFRNIR